MRKRGGLGDVVAEGTVLDQGADQQYWGFNSLVIVPHPDNYHYWLLVDHLIPTYSSATYEVDTLFAYLIGSEGISDAPIKSVYPLHSYGLGGLASPDGKLLTSARGGMLAFNAWSGTMTVINYLHPLQYQGPVAFSPDSRFLYCASPIGRGEPNTYYSLLQYDLRSSDPATTVIDLPAYSDDSARVFDFGDIASMILGPDGKIYCSHGHVWREPWLAAIKNPNGYGGSCIPIDSFLQYDSINRNASSLLNPLWIGVPYLLCASKKTQIQSHLVSCSTSEYAFELKDADPNFPQWRFDGGDPSTQTGSNVTVQFPTSGAHSVWAITSSGDTLFTIVTSTRSLGSTWPLRTNSLQLTGDSILSIAIQIKIDPAWGDDVNHSRFGCSILYDTSILAPTADWFTPASELFRAGQSRHSGTLTLIVTNPNEDPWFTFDSNDNFYWRDTFNVGTAQFQVKPSARWSITSLRLQNFSIYEGESRLDYCADQTSDTIARITNTFQDVALASKENSVLWIAPNPTRASAHIEFVMPNSSVVSFHLFDVLGRLMDDKLTFSNGFYTAGSHEFEIDLSPLTAGEYFVEMNTNGILTQEVILTKE
jgi:hypothetical protein